MKVGSLFSGIGGLDLGLERAGMNVIWQAEVHPYANAVLRKHWPFVPNLGDVREVDWSQVEQPDLICGGFPCQDISQARHDGPGIDGEQSGLWTQFAREPSRGLLRGGSWSRIAKLSAMPIEDYIALSKTFRRSGMWESGRLFGLNLSEPRIGEPDFGWLPTPTETANQTCPSMMKWPSCRNLVGLFGTGPIHPEVYEWMMGFPVGWTDLDDLETPSSPRLLNGSADES